MTLFPLKPWQLPGRRIESKAPVGQSCSRSPLCDGSSPRTIGYHCSVCHETFGGLGGFDKHRRNGWCLNPVDLGMEKREGIWRTPASEEDKQRLRLHHRPKRS